MHKIMYKKYFIFILVFSFVALSTFAQNEKLTEAENAYKANNFEQALKLYSEVETQGYTSSELLYNMGNCYYKLNKVAPAILYYERAKLLSPTDVDIETNLALANSKVTQKVDKLPEIMISTWIDSLSKNLDSNTWAYISILAFVAFVGMIGVFIFSLSVNVRKTMMVLGIFTLLVSGVTYFFASKQFTAHAERRYAIVFEPSIVARSAPSGGGTELFTIHEGIKIEVVKLDGEWAEIKLSDGKVGWLPVSAFTKI